MEASVVLGTFYIPGDLHPRDLQPAFPFMAGSLSMGVCEAGDVPDMSPRLPKGLKASCGLPRTSSQMIAWPWVLGPAHVCTPAAEADPVCSSDRRLLQLSWFLFLPPPSTPQGWVQSKEHFTSTKPGLVGGHASRAVSAW